jgi:hypothetical protein
LKSKTPPFLKVDVILYALSLILELGIVFAHHLPAPEGTETLAEHYLEKVLRRMDAVSMQLAHWERLDYPTERQVVSDRKGSSLC